MKDYRLQRRSQDEREGWRAQTLSLRLRRQRADELSLGVAGRPLAAMTVPVKRGNLSLWLQPLLGESMDVEWLAWTEEDENPNGEYDASVGQCPTSFEVED